MSLSNTVGRAALCFGAIVIGASSGAAQTQRLLNHVPKAVAESRRLGPVSETQTLRLAIGLPLRNREELDQLVAQIADPTSQNFRRYLTTSEFTERFGPTQKDYDKLCAMMERNGLTVAAKHSNRVLVDVSGSVGAINRMLHIQLTAWDHPAHGRFFAPDRDPTLEVGVPVLDIGGLDNLIVPKPMDVKINSLSSAFSFTSGSGPNGLFVGKDFRAAYAPGVALTGAGQTVGLVEFDGFYATDVTANFNQAGLPTVPVSTVLVDGFNGTPGPSNIEVILDIAMAGYMAPGANIVVYEGSSPNDILNRMATDNSAKQLSCSWGFSTSPTAEQIFKQMIVQGQSFFTASGDSGAYSGTITPPADDPNVTSVGGTALTTTGPSGTWVSETAWSGSGGGASTTYPIPSYQQSMNMAAQGASATMRNIPDVALTGAVQMYLIFNNGEQTAVGGTSAAAPLWAAFTAMANQQAAGNSKPSVGFLNPLLYSIGTAPGYSARLHDITTGSNGFPAVAGWDLSTGWGSPTGKALIDALSSIPSAPSFTLSSAPSLISVQTGSSGTSTIQVNAQNGFSGAVTLSISGLPSGVTGSFGAFKATEASNLTLSASETAATGTYSIVVKGVSGAVSANASLTLVVTAVPRYSLTSPPAITVIQGTSGTVPVTVSPANGFNGTVSLSVAGLPSGVAASFSPISTSTTSILTFTASPSVVVGISIVTVTGTSGNTVSTFPIALMIAPSVTLHAVSLSVSPSSGGGASGNFQFVASDTAGSTDIGAVEVVINSAFSADSACYLRYERAANRVWLVNDSGTQFTGPATLGIAGTLSNSQCSLNAASATATGSGNNLTITVPITFTSGFAGSKNIYLWAVTAMGQTTGYQQLGTWTVPTTTAPSPISVSPASGSGAGGSFQFVVSSSTGYGDVGSIEAIISQGFSGARACYVRYDRAYNRLWLVDDAGTQFTGPATLGASETLSNSQCSVNVAGVTAVGNGTNLTLTLPLTFAAGFIGAKSVYLWAVSMSGLASGYQQLGTWLVP